MKTMSDVSNRNSLSEFANAGAQQNQPRAALVQALGQGEVTPVGAQPVAVYRDEARVMQKIAALAAANSEAYLYRFPVKKQGGGVDHIEGGTIKLANDLARIYGNCSIKTRELDVGDAWVFYVQFVDFESGFTMERSFRQRKGQSSMRTRDADRQLDIAYQIGQSKAIRNVVLNSLQSLADFAVEHARNSLVEKIGKDLNGWRTRTVEGIAKMPVDLIRAERVIGKSAKDWLAPDVARIIAMMRSVADGMASVEETFPPIETDTKSAAPANDGATDGERERSNPSDVPAAAQGEGKGE
jgi:hypothetical protein